MVIDSIRRGEVIQLHALADSLSAQLSAALVCDEFARKDVFSGLLIRVASARLMRCTSELLSVAADVKKELSPLNGFYAGASCAQS